MMFPTYNKRKSRIFIAMMTLFLFYYSYRYVLQYNSSITSSTYKDTPMVFQLAKYVLLAICIMGLVLFETHRIKISRRNQSTTVLILFFLIQMMVLGAVSRNIEAISIGVILIPALYFTGDRDCPNFQHMEKLLMLFWLFSATYEFLQLILYFKTGRLTALGYPTGKFTDVRFGGAWDDPNGYALLMSFYIFYFLFRYKGIKQLCFIGFSALMLLLTWSGTGIIVFFAAAMIIVLLRCRDRFAMHRFSFWIFMVLIVGVAFLLLRKTILATEIEYFMDQKQGSIDTHLEGYDTSWVNILTLLGISPQPFFTEVGFLRLMSIGGIPAVLAFIGISIAGIRKLVQYISNTHKSYNASGKEHFMGQKGKEALLYGSLAYLIAFVLSMINLPLIVNFSCFGFFVVCICIANCVKRESVILETYEELFYQTGTYY